LFLELIKLKKKIILGIIEHYYFRHDLIRAYLAAKYFMRQWQTLLNEDNVTVDINWRSILEFTIFELETKHASEVALRKE
jgi:hypothetical protein